MPSDLVVDADVRFSVEVDGRMMTGTLQGSGSELELTVDDPRLLGGSGTATARAVADELAAHGVRLTVSTGRPLVTLGTGRSGFLQRKRHRVVPHLRRLAGGGAPHPRAAGLPDRDAAGAPAHAVAAAADRPASAAAPHHHARPRRWWVPEAGHGARARTPSRATSSRCSTWGRCRSSAATPRWTSSSPGSRPGTPRCGTPTTTSSRSPRSTPPGRCASTVRPRTARSDCAPAPAWTSSGWTLSFYREEWADHGRPYGGRVGGELGRQQLQPDRDELRRRRRP